MNQESVISQTQKQEFASFTDSRRKQNVCDPEWYGKIKELKENVTNSDIIVCRDINSTLQKNFAIFDSHQSLLNYSNNLQKEQRVLYEWLLPDCPARFVVDMDNSLDYQVITNPIVQSRRVASFLLKVISVFQELNIDCKNIRFKYSDSTREGKFSVHIVSKYYFE